MIADPGMVGDVIASAVVKKVAAQEGSDDAQSLYNLIREEVIGWMDDGAIAYVDVLEQAVHTLWSELGIDERRYVRSNYPELTALAIQLHTKFKPVEVPKDLGRQYAARMQATISLSPDAEDLLRTIIGPKEEG